MFSRKGIFCALAALALAAPGAAQDADFARFVEQANAGTPAPSIEEIAPVALAAVQQENREGGRCVPTAVRLEAPRPMTATRHVVQMIQSGELRNGWTAVGRLEGCDERRPLLFVVLRPVSGPLVAVPLMYGETIANPTLIIDTRPSALTAAGVMAHRLVPGCNDGAVALEGFRLVSTSADLGPDYYGVRYRGSWREAWTFAACGRRLEVPIEFTADGRSGTDYAIHASEARLVE